MQIIFFLEIVGYSLNTLNTLTLLRHYFLRPLKLPISRLEPLIFVPGDTDPSKATQKGEVYLEDIPGLTTNPDDSDEDVNITLQSVTNLRSCYQRLFNGIMQREYIRTFEKSFSLQIVMNGNWGNHLGST